MTHHQDKQIEIINQIEEQVKTDSLEATTVIPVNNFATDNRMCLTSVHFPAVQYTDNIYKSLITPLKNLFQNAYYYEPSSLHLTVKNIRVINDPPSFTVHDIETAKKVLNRVILKHMKFNIYPYRLLLFKNNLALMSTTDEELDRIILDLDEELKREGIPDDKKYINSRYFFSNMTLARFNTAPPGAFKEKIVEISSDLKLQSYCVDSVSLITSNAVMKKLTFHTTANLKD